MTRVHNDNPAWVCCCCGCLPFLGLIKGIILGILPALYFAIAVTGIAVICLPHDIYLVYKTVYSSVLLGRNLRFFTMLLLPFIIVAWVPFVVIVSSLVGVIGCVGFIAATVFDEDTSLLCGGAKPVWNQTEKAVIEFWLMNTVTVFTFVNDISGIPRGWDGQIYEIPLIKVFFGLLLTINGTIIGLIFGQLIAISKYFFVLLSANKRACKHFREVECHLIIFYLCGWLLMNVLSPLFFVGFALFGVGCGIGCAVHALNVDSLKSGYLEAWRMLREADEGLIELLEEDSCWPFGGSCFCKVPPSSDFATSMGEGGVRSEVEVVHRSIDALIVTFGKEMSEVVSQALSENLLTDEPFQDLDASVLIGVPALSAFNVLLKSSTNNVGSDEIFCEGGLEPLTIHNLPSSNIATVFWPKFKECRRALDKIVVSSEKLSAEDVSYLRCKLLNFGVDDMEMTAASKKVLASQGAALQDRRLNGLVSKINSLALDLSRVTIFMQACQVSIKSRNGAVISATGGSRDSCDPTAYSSADDFPDDIADDIVRNENIV